MATQHLHRILCIVPAGAKATTVASWLQSNIDPNADPAVGPGLSAAGSAPATHAWLCGAYTDPQAKAILAKLCQLAAVAPPSNAQWNGWSGAQKRAWLASVRGAILAGYGLGVWLADNTAAWDDAAAAAATMGLVPVVER